MEEKKRELSYKRYNIGRYGASAIRQNANNALMITAGVILKSWREQQSEENGLAPDKGLTVNDIAKAIGERYESVYRIERGGGSAAVLMKYLMLIRQYDKSFDLEKKLRELKHGDYPTFTL
ncbi:hypothetical protein PRBRB14_21640 [Hallella multisaccharivorax DSM 17128]|uniref:HTH cro/C1-type domain-containing protein n=1 Tax=Hallella multisaccharivorax DSM 17128 TaxID=688246 RepID=F8N7K9_9BACT|nr:hypothetical protein [Hallella multisaccharivorax]EGN57469.1 hypothetical protein Premu_2075 [Hallella multisaccharivorax DSM 17128]GJG31285.1 hypothetical protein PRBRB14_21640 [Hallella multisaccharivorax DSM 17128]